MNIHREYRGESGGYHIMMNGEQVYYSKDDYQASMFMAELKAKVAMSDEIQRMLSLNQRYKEALQKIAAEADSHNFEPWERMKEMESIAIKALEE